MLLLVYYKRAPSDVWFLIDLNRLESIRCWESRDCGGRFSFLRCVSLECVFCVMCRLKSCRVIVELRRSSVLHFYPLRISHVWFSFELTLERPHWRFQVFVMCTIWHKRKILTSTSFPDGNDFFPTFRRRETWRLIWTWVFYTEHVRGPYCGVVLIDSCVVYYNTYINNSPFNAARNKRTNVTYWEGD